MAGAEQLLKGSHSDPLHSRYLYDVTPQISCISDMYITSHLRGVAALGRVRTTALQSQAEASLSNHTASLGSSLGSNPTVHSFFLSCFSSVCFADFGFQGLELGQKGQQKEQPWLIYALHGSLSWLTGLGQVMLSLNLSAMCGTSQKCC